jgi:hypothetical protein
VNVRRVLPGVAVQHNGGIESEPSEPASLEMAWSKT